MSCQTSQKGPILSISKIWVHVMTFCLNVLPEALPAGHELRSAIIKQDCKNVNQVLSGCVPVDEKHRVHQAERGRKEDEGKEQEQRRVVDTTKGCG